MARLVVMRKGGGGKVAINPDHVTYVRSASGAFTDIFVADQQVAVEGTFEEVLARLTTPDPKAAAAASDDGKESGFQHSQSGGFVFGRLDR